MEWTLTYTLSQIFVIMMYIFLGTTYFVENRKTVLVLSFLSLVSSGVAYIFLGAYTGLAMVIVAIIRNIIFLLDEKKNGKRDKINKKDIVILIVLYIISIVSAIFTYDGFFSLLSVFATMLYTYSVWQKSVEAYKAIGIPTEILWLAYNIYLKSIFGIALEAILMIVVIAGYILEKKKLMIRKVKD